MNPVRWREIEALFEQASEIEPAQRSAFLQRVTNGDAALRKEVESLLRVDLAFGRAVEAAVQQQAELLAADPDDPVDLSFDSWRITGIIGRGGMGVVYRAERDDHQFEQQAAIKLVKRGMDTDAVLRRFRAERQILARLEHPNIARLIDGGVTESGLPYFVLEYVEGQPLLAYCNGAHLSIAQRLKLFREICSAVQYAHQNLVVHCDLKPGNIMVTASGTPKLLDFGVARLLNPDRSTAQTATIARMLTPDYASPEQVRGEPVSTATDIYSLGAVLYELLAGRPVHQFKNRSTTEIERVICQDEPVRPSALARGLPGDLDNIVLMALHKEPSRRYQSVEQLSDDVRRFLEQLPIVARKVTPFYRALKFVRRNRWPVMAALFVAVSLAAGIILATVQARRAERRYQQIRGFARSIIFEVNEEFSRNPTSIRARAMLVKTALDYLDKLAEETRGDFSLERERAKGYETVAGIQTNRLMPHLGDRAGAAASYWRAVQILEALRARAPADAGVQESLSNLYVQLGRVELDPWVALDSYRKAVALAEPLHAAEPKNPTYWTRVKLANIGVGEAQIQARDPVAALQTLRNMLARMSSGEGIACNTSIARALTAQGDLEGARAVLTKLLEDDIPKIFARSGIRNSEERISQETTISRRQFELGSLYGNSLQLNLGQPARALPYLRANLAIYEAQSRRQPEADTTALAEALMAMGAALRVSNAAQAVDYYRRALPLAQGELKARCYAEMALPVRKLGRRSEALAGLEKSLSSSDVQVWLEYGDALLEGHRTNEAYEAYRRARKEAEAAVAGAPHWMHFRRDLADCYQRLGAYDAAQGIWANAREWYRKSFEIWRDWSKWGVSSIYDQTRLRAAASNLARCDARLSR